VDARRLKQVEAFLRAGDYNSALRWLMADPELYNYVVTRMINALLSYPGGKISDLNGNVWNTADLAMELRRGRWLPVHFNFLLSEIDMIERELGV